MLYMYLSVVVPGKMKRRLVDGHRDGRRQGIRLVRHRDTRQINVAAFLHEQFGAAKNRRLRHYLKKK